MAERNVTSISVGKVIRRLLTDDEFIRSRVTKVFPVVTEKAELPYIAYRRAGHEPRPTQGGNADTATVEVMVFTEDYEGGIELAEAVRAALDGRQAEAGGLHMRSCTFADGEEAWQDDAYIQKLTFTTQLYQRL